MEDRVLGKKPEKSFQFGQALMLYILPKQPHYVIVFGNALSEFSDVEKFYESLMFSGFVDLLQILFHKIVTLLQQNPDIGKA